ncbi:MAG: cytidine deaminase [Paludibacteraceae bacterium]|nr:cytidine deaminase [Paludibacteraceae bacterium]
MKKYEIKTPVTACTWEELTPEQQAVVAIAREQINNSYCPYSGFHVGAAAELKNGMIVRGANQENAAYPSGLCAERTALFAAGAQYPDQPVMRLAIACFTDGHFTAEPGSPCGACRQVMIETEHRYHQPMEVLLYGEKETLVFRSAADLLPLIFVSENLNG